MIKIKLLKDWKSKKVGDIINISEEGAKSAINAGVAEYVGDSPKKKEKKYDAEKDIFKLCEKHNIVFTRAEPQFEDIKSVGLLPLLHNQLSKFLEDPKDNGFHILRIKDPETKAEYGVEINYMGNSEKADEDTTGDVEIETDTNWIKLPTTGNLVSVCATEVGEIFSTKEVIFYRQSSKDILEITMIKEKGKTKEYLGFSSIKPERFVTLLEDSITPFINITTPNGWVKKEKSMNSTTANILLNSPQLQNVLPKIKRIFLSPIPIIYKGKLTFPKNGYDKRFNSFMPFNAPKIDKTLSLEKAKETITLIFNEFCFQEKRDFTNAVAGLLTPFLRGLYPQFCERTPLFIYIGNRERTGKDYCANINGLVYEGSVSEETPISSGRNSGNENDELRKKLLSSFIAGKKRMHFANNKGHINNSIFEQVLTSEKYSDRVLGRNEILTFENEIDFSLSGNIGISFTADLINRSRMVKLFLDIEDANSRKFENPNLHSWIKDNRGLILSSLFAFVRVWVEKNKPDGKIEFASFYNWAKICGGIMECAGYDNPCKTSEETLQMGGDVETKDMKMLFELCEEKYKNTWIKKDEIRGIINEEGNLFGYLDLDKHSDKIKFGLKLTKFIGRILSDITLKIKDNNVRASRHEFMFKKQKKEKNKENIFGSVGNVGNVLTTTHKAKKNNKVVVEPLPSPPPLPPSENEIDFSKLKKEIEADE